MGSAIVVATPTGPRFPLLHGIDYVASTLNPGELELRFEIHDPDGQCATECRVEVLGANQADYEHRRPFNALVQQPERYGGTSTWRTTVNPKTEFNVNPGQPLYLDATLSGPFFSMRYPIGDDPLRISYLVDYTPYYIAAAVLGVVALLLLVFWLKPL